MGQLSRFLRHGTDNRLYYWCQGCESVHCVAVGEGDGPRWGYNGNPDRPTFTPSVLTQWDSWVPPAYPGWTPVPQHQEHHVCHTFITDGMVQFLGDCTHKLTGQTLPLPELPDHMKDDTP